MALNDNLRRVDAVRIGNHIQFCKIRPSTAVEWRVPTADEEEDMVQGAHRQRLGYGTLKCEVEP